MAKMTAQEYAEKWARNMKNSTTDIRRGVENVTVAPGIAAAKQSAAMLEGIRRSIENGTWQRAVAAVPLEDWKRQTLDKGINRIAAGVDGAIPKQEVMAVKLLAAVDAAKASIEQMPKTTLDDNINRMVAFSRKMAESKIK